MIRVPCKIYDVLWLRRGCQWGQHSEEQAEEDIITGGWRHDGHPSLACGRTSLGLWQQSRVCGWLDGDIVLSLFACRWRGYVVETKFLTHTRLLEC